MHDDHPAEQYRQVMAQLDAEPPPDPPPPPPPQPVVVTPPPTRTSLWDVLRACAPILIPIAIVVFACLLYHLSH